MKIVAILLLIFCASSMYNFFCCIFAIQFSVCFPILGFALNCQVCQKYGAGVCETAEDNGISVECPPELNACWYIYQGKTILRN